MYIVYNKYSGEIVTCMSKFQNINIFFKEYPENFKENLKQIYIEYIEIADEIIQNLKLYKIKDSKLTKRDEIEITELQLYGRVLTEEERVSNRLKPSLDEVKKAENTIEILSLLQEVGI